MYLFEKFLDILFPRKCLGCQKSGTLFCTHCQNKTPKPFAELEPWIHSIFQYKNPLTRKVVWTLKYRNGHAVAKDLAPRMYDEIISTLSEQGIDRKTILLVPIPMTDKKKRERGFNQSEVLAKELWRQNKGLFQYANILRKTRETIPQAHIKNKQRRLQNMKGVFAVKNHNPTKNQTIILIDDITTTGATLKEAQKTLRINGFRHISAITIGH